MTRQILLRSPAVDRRQPLLNEETSPKHQHRRFGEVAGGTTAECAAVCCCCPCAMMHLLIMAVYRVPTGLCKKALRKQRRKKLMKKKQLLLQRPATPPNQLGGPNAAAAAMGFCYDESEAEGDDGSDGDDDNQAVFGNASAAVDLEKVMWDQFYGTGFWRSSSQRENESSI
ncbi:uncharacterized protein LOC132306350 [Cornus florida]|uniref:uncharacterized protein LOC132306350 n=1 Tax=Cornus florida TaxID=4283 RepID=UPI002899D517|nr:uncharacterized protein LOC132306350 [Cornus florida]